MGFQGSGKIRERSSPKPFFLSFFRTILAQISTPSDLRPALSEVEVCNETYETALIYSETFTLHADSDGGCRHDGVFYHARVIPADPVGAILGSNAPIELVDRMRHQLGLDKPIHQQFVDYLNGIVHGDFGVSLKTNRPVTDDLKEFFPATLELAIASILITIIFGILFGILSAVHRNKLIDHVMRILRLWGSLCPCSGWGFYCCCSLLCAEWLPGSGRHSLFVFPPHYTGMVVVDCLIAGDWATLWMRCAIWFCRLSCWAMPLRPRLWRELCVPVCRMS